MQYRSDNSSYIILHRLETYNIVSKLVYIFFPFVIIATWSFFLPQRSAFFNLHSIICHVSLMWHSSISLCRKHALLHNVSHHDFKESCRNKSHSWFGYWSGDFPCILLIKVILVKRIPVKICQTHVRIVFQSGTAVIRLTHYRSNSVYLRSIATGFPLNGQLKSIIRAA